MENKPSKDSKKQPEVNNPTTQIDKLNGNKRSVYGKFSATPRGVTPDRSNSDKGRKK